MTLSLAHADTEAAAAAGERLLRRYGAVPLGFEDGRRRVALADPADIHALDDLKMVFAGQITPVVAEPEAIARVLERLFPPKGRTDAPEEPLRTVGAASGEVASPVVRLVNSLLQEAVDEGASDVHIEPRAGRVAVRLRVDGVLREARSLPAELHGELVARVKILARMNIAERRVPLDGSFRFVPEGGAEEAGIDLRVASLPTRHGEKVAVRLHGGSRVRVGLESLGFEPEVLGAYRRTFGRSHGAVLVTGPTGSGKSTTLYATLDEINTPERNLVTVEDPVERQIPGVNQVEVDEKAGLTFATGLRSILRSDPEVIMVGEIRDYQTARMSVESALTGHLVLATLHTRDAPGALTRLADMGIEPFLISSAIDAVLAQRLLRRLCASCRRPVALSAAALRELDFPPGASDSAGLAFHEPGSCAECGGTGYRGRVGIYELLAVTDEVREAVVRRAAAGEIGQLAESRGMVRLRQDGLLKAARGITSVEEALRWTG